MIQILFKLKEHDSRTMITNFVLCLVCFLKPEFPALRVFSLNLLTKPIRDKNQLLAEYHD